MLNSQDLNIINQVHDQVHFEHPYLENHLVQLERPDKSCTICYPPSTDIIPYFQNFWNWYYITFPVTQYSAKTYKYFGSYSISLLPAPIIIEKIICSIRYSELIDLNRVKEEVLLAFEIYFRFSIDPAEVDIINPSPSLDIPFATTIQPLEFNDTNSDRTTIQSRPYTPISDLESLDLDLLFEMATSQTVLDYLRSNLNNNILRVDTFFGDGTQDPLTWFDTFTKARKANTWPAEKALLMFVASIQDEAEDWWTVYLEDNDGENDAFRWPNIELAFTRKFCNQRWQNKWMRDLEGRRQGPREPIDSYYNDFKKLIKRIDVQGAMTGAQRL